MIMGEAAGTAAALAARSKVDVQDVDIKTLQSVLRKNGVIFRSAASQSVASPTTDASLQPQPIASSRTAPATQLLGNSRGDGSPWLLALLGAALVVALGAGAAAWRRRGRPRTT